MLSYPSLCKAQYKTVKNSLIRSFPSLRGEGEKVSFRTNTTIKTVRFPNKTKLGWQLQVHTPRKYKFHLKKKLLSSIKSTCQVISWSQILLPSYKVLIQRFWNRSVHTKWSVETPAVSLKWGDSELRQAVAGASYRPTLPACLGDTRLCYTSDRLVWAWHVWAQNPNDAATPALSAICSAILFLCYSMMIITIIIIIDSLLMQFVLIFFPFTLCFPSSPSPR